MDWGRYCTDHLWAGVLLFEPLPLHILLLAVDIELATNVCENFTIVEKAPSRAFSSWLKAHIVAFTFKTLFSVP